jgi:hypothetical protein
MADGLFLRFDLEGCGDRDFPLPFCGCKQFFLVSTVSLHSAQSSEPCDMSEPALSCNQSGSQYGYGRSAF